MTRRRVFDREIRAKAARIGNAPCVDHIGFEAYTTTLRLDGKRTIGRLLKK